MKKSLVALALLAAFAAHAQDSNSTSQSGSNSGSTSNSGATAIGNQNSSQSASGSQSGASSGSQSGALGNVINLDQSVPSNQTVNQNVTGNTTSRAEQILSGRTTVDENVRYSGSTTQNVVSSGSTRQDVHYSGTQTLKNVPGIAMSGPASGPCTGASGGLGLAGPGWGVGLNGSTVMVDCRLRENTRVMGMAMQSLDGAAQPQEKGEATVLFMDALRGLAAYNNQLLASEVNQPKK